MIGPVKIGLRVRHHSHDSSRLITDARNSIERSIWIEGIIHDRLTIGLIRILKGDQLLPFQLLLEGSISRDELPLSMTDRKICAFHPLREERRGFGIYL